MVWSKAATSIESGGSIDEDGGKHEHPVEHQWNKRGDHETHVNHAVCSEGKPTILSFLRDSVTLGLLRSRNGSTGVFGSHTDTEKESKISRRRSTASAKSRKNVIAVERGLATGRGYKGSLFRLTDKQ